MTDLDKTLIGLECLITNEISYEGCPYSGSGYCLKNIAKDARELLKEQDKIIKDLKKRLRLLEYGDQDAMQSGLMPAT